MQYKTDIEIAQACEMKPIMEIAKKAHVDEKYVEQYGKYKAKIDLSLLDEDRKNGKLILVTAITPTPEKQAMKFAVCLHSLTSPKTGG